MGNKSVETCFCTKCFGFQEHDVEENTSTEEGARVLGTVQYITVKTKTKVCRKCGRISVDADSSSKVYEDNCTLF